MAATIADLLLGKPDLITTRADKPIKEVLAVMIAYDYSQLPVIDDGGQPVGLVTSDSIVRALHNFAVKTDGLCVKDAMVKKPATYYPSDDVFDLLDDLETDAVVLVINDAGTLIGLITTYDTTSYLRQRAEDIMVVREVEEMVKGYINAAFTNPQGAIDQQKQQAAITEITPSSDGQKNKFRQALKAYLSQPGQPSPTIDSAQLDAAFQAHLYEKPWVKPFDRLTLGEYINLFLHPQRWPTYSAAFSIDRDAIRHLLDAVRQTRNALAHFRDDITTQQREELRFCKEWLARHEKAINSAFGVINGTVVSPEQSTGVVSASLPALIGDGTGTIGTPTTTQQPAVNGTPTEILSDPSNPQNPRTDPTVPSTEPPTTPDDDLTPGPLDEIPDKRAGRYGPLVRHLSEQAARVDKLRLSFNEIDALLGEHQLPESARKYRAWWANDSVSHVQSQQWLEAGWRVTNLNMTEELVTFGRITDNEQAYLQFFTALQHELEQAAPGLFHPSHHAGRYWLTIDTVRAGNRSVAWFYCSFTRTKRFRVELSIDTQDQQTTKQLFDALLDRKELIEAEVGDRLSWERLDMYRVSRIARFYPGSITDTTGSLANLRARAVEAVKRFVPVLKTQLVAVIPSVLGEAGADPLPEAKP